MNFRRMFHLSSTFIDQVDERGMKDVKDKFESKKKFGDFQEKLEKFEFGSFERPE